MTDTLTLTPGEVTLADLEAIYRKSLAVKIDRSAQPAIERAAAAVAKVAAGDEAEKAVIYFDCPEALTAVYDFIKIKFIPDKNMHGFLFPFNEWELFYKHYILLPAFFKDMIK